MHSEKVDLRQLIADDEADWRNDVRSVVDALTENARHLKEGVEVGDQSTIDKIIQQGPTLMDQLRALSTLMKADLNRRDASADWKNKVEDLIKSLSSKADILNNVLPQGDKHTLQAIVDHGPAVMTLLRELEALQQAGLAQIKKSQKDHEDSIAKTDRDLQRKQSQLRGITSQIQLLHPELTNLTHNRLEANAKLQETRNHTARVQADLQTERDSLELTVSQCNANLEERIKQMDTREQDLATREATLEEARRALQILQVTVDNDKAVSVKNAGRARAHVNHAISVENRVNLQLSELTASNSDLIKQVEHLQTEAMTT